MALRHIKEAFILFSVQLNIVAVDSIGQCPEGNSWGTGGSC